jgi:hypothetical protein
MTRAGHPREGKRGQEAQRLKSALWGKDKAGDDKSPAVDASNAGLSRREEIALNRENGRPFGLNMTAQTIRGRVNGSEYDRRH